MTYSHDLPLPYPTSSHSPDQGKFWDEVTEHAQGEGAIPPGFAEPSPWGPPLKRADPNPEPIKTAIAPEVHAKPRTVRKGRPQNALAEPMPTVTAPPAEGVKPKRKLTLPKLGIKIPAITVPSQVHALFTPLMCAIAAWSLAAHFVGTGTQGIVAMSIMSALPLTLLWFLMDVASQGLRAKCGVFGMVLLPVTVMFATMTTIAPYSALALISYLLYYPAVRGHLRRFTTWFCASAIAWSLTIFIQ